MKYATPLIMASLACMPIIAQAQEDSTQLNVVYDTLMPVEVIGIRAQDIAPFAFDNVYKHEFLKYQTGQDIAYTLESLPSIVSNSDAGNGVGYTDIRVRGTDMQRINFTLNGIPLNDAESQGTFFVNMPDLLSSTQSIQIQRGVGSSTNGPGSFGASINLSNIHASSDPHLETSHSVGSFNTIKNSISVGTGIMENGLYSTLRLSAISSDGYIDRASSSLQSLHFLTGWNSKDLRTSIKFNMLMGKEKTGQAWNGVSEDMMMNNRRFNELGLMDNGAYYTDQTDNYQQHYFQLFAQHQFSDKWMANVGLFYTRGLGYYNEYRMGESFDDYFLPPVTIDTTTFHETSLIRQLWLDNHFYGIVYNTQYASNNTTINIGGSISQYNNQHFGIVKWATLGVPADHKWYDNPADKFDANVYVKWTQELSPKLYSYVDLQGRFVDYNIYGFRKSPDVIQNNEYFFFNPKAGFTYQANTYSQSYLSFGVANKEPNRDDFEASLIETPIHETLYDVELGYEYNKKRLKASAQLYYMHYKNQLINTGKINDVGAYTRTNIPLSFRRGIEISANYKAHKQLSMHGHVTLSQNKIKDFTEYIDDYDHGGQIENSYSQTDISLSPSVISYLQLSTIPFRSMPQLQWDITGRYISRQYLDNTSNINRSIDPYFTLNTILQYHFKLAKKFNMNVNISVQNILNTTYASKGYTYSYVWDGMQTYNYFFPQAGRQFFLTLNTRL